MNSFYEYSLFKLEDAYELGVKVSMDINNMMSSGKLTGRLAGKPHDYGILSQAFYNVGFGNFLEIGALFGGAALVLGEVAKYFGADFHIYIVDPLDGYYGKGNIDPVKKIIPTKDVLEKNLNTLGLGGRYTIFDRPSYPFPIDGVEFSVSYIDGDHWGDMPYKDFLSIKDVTKGYVVFDNYDSKHTDVVKAVEKALLHDDYTLVHLSSISAVLQRNANISNPFIGVTG